MYCRYSWEEYLESEGTEVQLSRYQNGNLLTERDVTNCDVNVYHECLLPAWLKSCGTFLRSAVVDWTINIMCRHPALHGQSRADLKVVK